MEVVYSNTPATINCDTITLIHHKMWLTVSLLFSIMYSTTPIYRTTINDSNLLIELNQIFTDDMF